MKPDMTRRSFVKGTVLSSAALTLALEGRSAPPDKPAAPAPAPSSALPKGRIGKLEVSRLILGGNLLTHYTHSRDLRYVYTLAAHYNTDEKILETLATAEAHGINTLTMHNPPHPMSLLRRYRKERGGKIQWIICPTAPVEPGLAEYRQHVEELDQGRLRSDLPVGRACRLAGGAGKDRPGRRGGRVAEEIRRAVGRGRPRPGRCPGLRDSTA